MGNKVSEDEVARLAAIIAAWDHDRATDGGDDTHAVGIVDANGETEWRTCRGPQDGHMSTGYSLARLICGDPAALSGVPEGAASGGHTWPEHADCAVADCAVAYLAASVPSPEPLDVERLARVFFETDVLGTMFMPEARRRAERIAAEYARLAAPQPVSEDGP